MSHVLGLSLSAVSSFLFLVATAAAAALLQQGAIQTLLIDTAVPLQISQSPSSIGRIVATLPHYNETAFLRLAGRDKAARQDRDELPLEVLLHGWEDDHLVWVTREVVDASLEFQVALSTSTSDWVDQLQESLLGRTHSTDPLLAPYKGSQVPLSASASSLSPRPKIMAIFDNKSALLSVPQSCLSSVDLYLPRFTQASLLSLTKTPLIKAKEEPTFPSPALSAATSKLLRSEHLSVTSLNKTATILSGEDQSSIPLDSTWTSRHSATYGGRLASNWILAQAREALANVSGARCEQEFYGEGNFSPNVVCIVPGHRGEGEMAAHDSYEEGAILLSAHYDSRGSFGNPRAPGGNDDGSGSTMLLAIIRVLGERMASDQKAAGSSVTETSDHRSRRRELQLVFFSGEEQGLVGSKHYATALATSLSKGLKLYAPAASTLYRSTSLRFALQTDMIGFQSPSEPLQLAFPNRLATVSATQYVWSTAQLYVPELVVGYTPACCSDHQSFWEAGYPATWVFERNGPILDDKYHNSGDLVLREGYDLQKVGLIGKVVLACAVGLIWE